MAAFYHKQIGRCWMEGGCMHTRVCPGWLPLVALFQASDTPFTKTSPNYPHKNNADNSIKIAFTNSENNPHFIYERP